MGKEGRKTSPKIPTVPKKTAVWWDINSCPVPDDVDPGWIRPMIESALKKSPDFAFGLEEVTIFAYGNLMHVPTHQNKAISSSGIKMRHNHWGIRDFINEMEICKSTSRYYMFITQYPEYTVLPAFLGNPWGWKT